MKNNLAKILASDSIVAAPQLLGWVLCRRIGGEVLRLKIVETEAYYQSDPASHSFRGLTKRTAPMFETGGHIYVYFTYGMHYALNIVTGPAGRGEAVLIRAGEPLTGIEIMEQNRKITDIKNLTNGPGKLAQALGIFDTTLSGKKLNKLTIWLEPPTQKIKEDDIVVGPRIGIRQAVDQPWRFYIKDNQYVSKL